jgi:predicted nucleotidyltransferase
MSASVTPDVTGLIPADWKITPALLGVLGSTAYGLATASSDQDRIGVYVAPTKKVLGLRAREVVDHTYVSSSPDIAVHELAKYASLALKCNPTVIELLYATHYDVCDDIGAQLVELRSAFPSTDRVRGAFGGYVSGQLKDIVRRAPEVAGSDAMAAKTKKNARHCFRLLRSGLQLLTTGSLVLDVGDYRDELYAVGDLAVTDVEDFQVRLTAALADFDAASSVLPDCPDRDKIDRFVVDTRLGLITK